MKSVGSRTIQAGRVVLRAVQAGDAAALARIRSLPMSPDEACKAVDGMVKELQKPFSFHWVITLEGTVIGRVKAWDVNPYNGYMQLGYDIGAAYRNQGYMTEAVHAVVRYLMEEAGAHRVFCSVRESNPASCRVCEKVGMRHEGTLHQHYARQDGGFDDVRIYGILQGE